MKKILYMVLLVAAGGTATAQKAPSRDLDWGMLLDLGVAGNYEDAFSKDTVHMKAVSILAEIGSGIYIERFFIRGYTSIGGAVSGDAEIFGRPFSIKDSITSFNLKAGAEFSANIINGKTFGFGIPIGYSFNFTEYKMPSMIDLHIFSIPNDEIFWFVYQTIYSGINISLTFGDFFSFIIFARAGYPIFQDFEYAGVNTSNNKEPAKHKAEIYGLTAGILFRLKLFGRLALVPALF